VWGFLKLNRQFTATLQKSPNKGGWTSLIWPDKAEPYTAIGKKVGDPVTVNLEELI